MNQEYFQKIAWKKFSIMEVEPDNKALILICENKDISIQLHEVLSTMNHDIVVSIKPNKEYAFSVDFIDTEYKIYYDTHMKLEDYPPLGWLATLGVKYVTTGFRDEIDKKIIRWNQGYLPLIRPSLN